MGGWYCNFVDGPGGGMGRRGSTGDTCGLGLRGQWGTIGEAFPRYTPGSRRVASQARPSLGFVVSQLVVGTCLRGRGVPGCVVRRHCPGVTGAAVRIHCQLGWLKQSPAGELPRGPQNRSSVWVVGCPSSSDWPAQSPVGELPRGPQEPCMCFVLSNSAPLRHVRD